MEQKENKFEKIKNFSSKISRKKMLIIILGVVVLGTASFFAQKYIRLYLKYQDFQNFQYYLEQRNKFYGENNKVEDWSFGRYLQYLDEAKGAEKKAMEEQEKLLDVYRQDTIGGKTPEETLAGFVDALKKKDFDLASKYVILEEQESFKKELEGHSEENINKMINGLDGASNKWTEDTNLTSENFKSYYYKTMVDEREVTVSVEFKLNPYSNVWKIKSF